VLGSLPYISKILFAVVIFSGYFQAIDELVFTSFFQTLFLMIHSFKYCFS